MTVPEDLAIFHVTGDVDYVLLLRVSRRGLAGPTSRELARASGSAMGGAPPGSMLRRGRASTA